MEPLQTSSVWAAPDPPNRFWPEPEQPGEPATGSRVHVWGRVVHPESRGLQADTEQPPGPCRHLHALLEGKFWRLWWVKRPPSSDQSRQPGGHVGWSVHTCHSSSASSPTFQTAQRAFFLFSVNASGLTAADFFILLFFIMLAVHGPSAASAFRTSWMLKLY